MSLQAASTPGFGHAAHVASLVPCGAESRHEVVTCDWATAFSAVDKPRNCGEMTILAPVVTVSGTKIVTTGPHKSLGKIRLGLPKWTPHHGTGAGSGRTSPPRAVCSGGLK